MADAQDSGYDIYLITSGPGRLIALNFDGGFDHEPPPAADDDLQTAYYRLAFDADAERGEDELLTPDMGPSAIDAALEGLDGIDGVDVIDGGGGDFLISITAPDGLTLGLPPVLEHIDYGPLIA